MIFFRLALFCYLGTLTNILADAKIRRPEEYWRPATARDLNKYKPRDAVVSAAQEEVDNVYVQFARSLRQESLRKLKHETQPREKRGSEVECGIEGPPESQSLDRIVGGRESEAGQWPWMVALFIDDAWFCGGSIISEEWVMTAGHCADGAKSVEVMLGAHNVREDAEDGRMEIISTDIVQHESYNPFLIHNDIALIHLPQPIEFNGDKNKL